MARGKKEPKHNPEQYRRHLSQAIYHLGLAEIQLAYLGQEGDNSQIYHIEPARSAMQDALAASLTSHPAAGFGPSNEEEEED